MSKKEHKETSALTEINGIIEPESISSSSILDIKNKRKKQPSAQSLINAIIKGDVTALSRAITLIESTNPKHSKKAETIIKGCLAHTKPSKRIGITGVPGVGKSTFIEAFGTYLTGKGHKIAILAIDPSSSLSKGSILGDKTRMDDLVKDSNAFIRPSASGSSLGGVARKTRESIILCEAAGYDTIIIETIGVGQSETAVHSMVDFFLLLKLAGAGDELQGIKRGIIEMADAIVINKADGDNIKRAKTAKVEFNRALHLYPEKDSGWSPKVKLCSALHKKGIEEVWLMFEDYLSKTKANSYFNTRRLEQQKYWLLQTIEDRLKTDFYNRPEFKKGVKAQLCLIEKGETTPFAAAEYLLGL
ncbi:methylmalonyl Co-A mutase-associated GTPase MeaB [Ichthyenterobacterium sp. W332]|uniref:Methylmalonyl Co-A mutase-associated GTPase MeaB n=1 Tax=Microcosmobacter mediterraneus TaxID=3075607 RepID=A0ABU2YGX5_9FLAO|nr:methylmalonyl Co-A mutase-associated GTPase MeaB [Ichthyenterobacterium sp. W332]MDT0557141.1 methylmalonyl Co-A mutase-associated GTPase MeaB [Ichthyenterobacterium sp. W332]